MALLPLLSSTAVKIDCCYERHEKPSDSGSWAQSPIYIAEVRERGKEGRKGKKRNGGRTKRRGVYASLPSWRVPSNFLSVHGHISNIPFL